VGFVRQASAAVILVAVTLWFQCAGMAILIHSARAAIARGMNRLNPWHSAVLMIRFTIVKIVLHFLQTLLWAAFYRWHGLPSWESCFYFSATSYSTVGYGDVVLPKLWRNLGPIESVIGVIMCGISVSGLFAIAIRLIDGEAGSSTTERGRPVSVPVPELD
jgi:voltage-gated potassium channel